MRVNRRDRYGRAGFVLPTVTMVILVVVLLSLAITFRAFERAKDAQYTRVSQQTLNAASPAIARAQAKISEVMRELDEDSTRDLSDQEIYKALTAVTQDEKRKYTFGDEDIINVRYDINENGSIQANGKAPAKDGRLDGDDELKDNEQIQTAWRFPVDTNNDGDPDSYNLYGIFFRNPLLGEVRTPLDSRTLPMPPLGLEDEECAFASRASDNLLTAEGWVPIRGKLEKSIFVYTVTVPINEEKDIASSPLEYQQDWQQKPLRGVVYRDDLEIAPGPEFNLNGSLKTTSNLIVSHFGNNFKLYQVSGKGSCFYDADLSNIEVGGNVLNGMVGNNSSGNQRDVEVHLFQGEGNDSPNPKIENISTTNQSTTDGVFSTMYKDQPYRERLENLVSAQLGNGAASDPSVVQEIVNRRTVEDATLDETKARREELEKYFRARLRKVPQADNGDTTGTPVGSGDTLAPPEEWSSVDDAGVSLKADQLEATEPETQRTKGVENFLGDRVLVGNNLPALELRDGQWVSATQKVGKWSDEENSGVDRTRVTQAEELPAAADLERDGFWEKTAAKKPETAFEGIGGLRVITGAGVYERRYSFLPPPTQDGKLVYNDPATTDEEKFPIVWPDTMPMFPLEKGKVYDNSALYDNRGNPDPSDPSVTPTTFEFDFDQRWAATPGIPNPPPGGVQQPTSIDRYTRQYEKGDLRMRATAVYHYAQDSTDLPDDTDQKPIACVSSYYDPTSSITAENIDTLPWPVTKRTTKGRSNNGIVYDPPSTDRPDAASTEGAGRLLGGTTATELEQQANYVFPDGRFANEPLRQALLKREAERTLAEKAAIDSTLCALDILQGEITPNTVIPHGAIREVAMLNAREVKAVEQDNNTTTTVDETFTLSSPLSGTDKATLSGVYNLPLEDRQPLEVRLTQLDLDVLRKNTIANTETTDITLLNPEYLLPYSGVIYASRDDALPDRSYREEGDGAGLDEEKSKALSPTDFQLDPTRRPNGILLVNGESLGRGNEEYSTEQEVLREQGLTLVSNLPVYIQGTFNRHSQQEFNGGFSWNFNAFYERNRNNLNDNFACRPGDPIRAAFGKNCSQGDNWRPATVLADAITLVSENFRFGYRDEGDFDLGNHAGNPVVGYDFDNDGIKATDLENEDDYKIDLNGNGDFTDTNVPETKVTAKAARQLNGFNAYNDFAINGLSSKVKFDTDNNGTENETYDDEKYRNNKKTDGSAADSTYFNNFVTPVQRRGDFSEYVMEICPKLPVSACQPDDWKVAIDAGGAKNGEFDAKEYKGTTEAKTSQDALAGGGASVNDLLSGTTAKAPSVDLKRFPRRVAFKRVDPNANNFALDTASSLPQPLGIDGGDKKVKDYTGTGVPRKQSNALWFKTRTGTTSENWGYDNPLWYYDLTNKGNSRTFTTATVQQPLLVPALQLHATDKKPKGSETGFPKGKLANEGTRWLPRPADNTEFNLVLGAGDVPGRPNETNGGLQNLARFLENWQTPEKSTTIFGSFVQSGRSSYSTSPFISLSKKEDGEFFGKTNTTGYNIDNANQRIGYFNPPARNWGFDVGLFSQPPDYFTRKFARLDATQSGGGDESEGQSSAGSKDYEVEQFYREVARDDKWVKALLCAKDQNNQNVLKGDGRPDCKEYGG